MTNVDKKSLMLITSNRQVSDDGSSLQLPGVSHPCPYQTPNLRTEYRCSGSPSLPLHQHCWSALFGCDSRLTRQLVSKSLVWYMILFRSLVAYHFSFVISSIALLISSSLRYLFEDLGLYTLGISIKKL